MSEAIHRHPYGGYFIRWGELTRQQRKHAALTGISSGPLFQAILEWQESGLDQQFDQVDALIEADAFYKIYPGNMNQAQLDRVPEAERDEAYHMRIQYLKHGNVI